MSSILTDNNLSKCDNKRTKQSYAKIATLQDIKTQLFLSSCRIHNRRTFETKQIDFDLDWSNKQSYLYKTFVVDELNYNALQDERIPIFITVTLPSPYHPSSAKYMGLTIEDGYKKLVEFFRHLQDNFRHERKRVDFKYFRVCEPHKTFVPHFHSIVWIPKNSVSSFLRHHKNTVKLFNFNFKGQDLKVLDSAKYAVTYLMKYVQKTLQGVAYVRGWKIKHKIRLVSSSRSSVPSVVFKKISSAIKFDKDSPIPYLLQIKEKCLMNVRIYDVNKVVVKNVSDDRENVEYCSYVEKERSEHFKSVASAYCLIKRTPTHYIFESFYKYKILNFDITYLPTFSIYYDSNDFVLLRDGEEVGFNIEVGEGGVHSEDLIYYNDDGSTSEVEVIDYVE